MKYISKHSFIALFFGIVLSVWSGCTDEADIDKTTGNGNSAADGTRLIVRATASGFQAPAQSGDSPATRTPVMEGTITTFQTGDAIGLFCIRKDASGNEYVAEDIRNLKMTYTVAADGTGTWEAPTAESAPLVYIDAVTYFAYYPYTEELTTANVSNEQTIRTWLKTNKPLATDMLTPAELAANDLMTATALPSLAAADRGALALNFKHEYALLVVKPMGGIPCTPPPSVASVYSYYAGAKVWGIDKNLTQSEVADFKMKINNGKACEMSDGTYRILTNATTSGSQISCDYVTYNDGLLPVTAIGSSISGGFQANTCYTLEVRCNGASGGAAVERAVQPGDFVVKEDYNGAIKIYPGDGPVDVNGKIPDYANALGIVTSCSRFDMDRDIMTNGWYHALVMSTKKSISHIGSNIRWCIQNRNEAELTDVTTVTQAKDYMRGYADTRSALSFRNDCPVFENLSYFREDVSRLNNSSLYFLPATGVWYDLLTNLGGKSPDDFNNNTATGWSSDQDGATILGAINARLNKIGESLPERTRFPCSTEAGSQAWMVRFNGNTIDFSPADKTLEEYTPVFFFSF